MDESLARFEDFEQADLVPAGHLGEPWEITTDDAADWAIRKIAASQATVAEREAYLQRHVARITAWVEQAQREASREQAFFEGKLRGYFERLKESGKVPEKKKSWSLPSGRLQLRSTTAKWEIASKEEVEAYAEANELQKVVVSPDMARIKELCESGVDVPGMTMVRQAGESFSIIVNKESAA